MRSSEDVLGRYVFDGVIAVSYTHLVSGKGERGANGGSNGDLYIEIMVMKHDYFVRDGRNIYITIPISSVDATLGCSVDVPTVYGDVELTIPSGTQNGQQFRLKGKGVKDLRGSCLLYTSRCV